MKKFGIILFISLLIFGCSVKPKSKAILAKVNNYEITKEEFEAEFIGSIFGGSDTRESRKEFLDNLINRKLIIQDAEAKGLDKEPGFLKSIERFWEQSLLKAALDRKAREISGSLSVNDNAIEEAYKKMAQEGKTDKSYDQLYGQIKWEMSKVKESQAISSWLKHLRDTSKIEVNNDLLEGKIK